MFICISTGTGDLKSANILVDSRFRAKLADFGLSQKSQLGGAGTPFWMAPEVLRFESDNTASTDVYSFGIVLYEVFSRRDPYEGEDLQEVLSLVADKTVQKRPVAPSHMPDPLQSVMRDCLEDDPQARPSFQEIEDRLKRFDAGKINQPGVGNMRKGRMRMSSVSLFDIFPR